MANFLLGIGNRNYSSWSLRGWLMMKLTGVEFETKIYPLFTTEGMKALRQDSPNKKVPYLSHGDFNLSESLALGEYLAELNPSIPFWPSDQKARAEARAICAQMASGFFNVRGDMPMNIRREDIEIEFSDALLDEIAQIEKIWIDCRERYGQSGLYLFGEYSIADMFFAPVVWRFRSYNPTLSDASRDYMETMLARSDMQEWKTLALEETWVIEEAEV